MASYIIYMGAFLISIWFSHQYQMSELKRISSKPTIHLSQYVWFVVVFASPILIATYRFGVGTDYFTYLSIYQGYSNLGFISPRHLSVEYGYYLINFIADYLFNDFSGVLFLSSLITLLFFFLSINKFKTQISIAFSLFILFMTLFPPMFNGIRQLIAVSVVMYAFSYIKKGGFFKFLILVVAASFFHRTALICLPLYFFVGGIETRLSSLKKIMFFLMLAGAIFLLPLIFDFLGAFSFFKDYFMNYEIGSDSKVINQILLRLPVLIPILINSRKLIENNNKYEFYIYLFILEILFIFVGAYYVWGVRLTYYTMTAQVILVPAIVRNISDKNKKLLLSFYFICWYIFYFIYLFSLKGNDGIFPYRFLN